MNKNILKITQTAVFLALLIILQYFTKPLGQFVTGSCVNLILILSTALVGLYSGIFIAIVSPFLAFLLGIGPAFLPLVPVIAIGNVVIVLISGYFLPQVFDGKFEAVRWLKTLLVVVAGPVAKFLVLWVGVTKIAVPLISSNLKPAQITAINLSFSWPQLVTALIGVVVALVLYPILKKAIHK